MQRYDFSHYTSKSFCKKNADFSIILIYVNQMCASTTHINTYLYMRTVA